MIAVLVAPARAQDADVPLRVSGRVIGVNGKPVAGGARAGPGGWPQTRTDRDGRYTLAGVDRGATLAIDAPGYTTALATVTGTSLDDVVVVAENAANEVIDVRGAAPAIAPGAAKLDRDEVERI